MAAVGAVGVPDKSGEERRLFPVGVLTASGAFREFPEGQVVDVSESGSACESCDVPGSETAVANDRFSTA